MGGHGGRAVLDRLRAPWCRQTSACMSPPRLWSTPLLRSLLAGDDLEAVRGRVHRDEHRPARGRAELGVPGLGLLAGLRPERADEDRPVQAGALLGEGDRPADLAGLDQRSGRGAVLVGAVRRVDGVVRAVFADTAFA